MSDKYSPREMRLMAERDAALDRAEAAEAGFKNVAVIINKSGGGIRRICEDYNVAEAWVKENDRFAEHYIHVHPVERRRNVRP